MESHPESSVALHVKDWLPEFFTITEAVVAVVPRSTARGDTTKVVAEGMRCWGPISTGEEELQAAAIAAHTLTGMAARRARLMDDFT